MSEIVSEIRGFFGPYRWLSNFYPAPVILDGVEYPTVEHAYQAAKSLSAAEREQVRTQPSPGATKRYAKKLTCRKNWNEVKIGVMEALLRQKFALPDFRAALIATGDAYIEETNSWHDTFWGVCDGVGENHLGKLIMKIRDEKVVKEA